MNNRIYTHDEAARIVELFEDLLDKHDITVPSPDDDQRDSENDARLYSIVYADLLGEVENILINLLSKNVDFYDVITGEFSGDY